MARKSSAGQGAPEGLPQGSPPRDLHPTSDIRFVMVEVAKLTERIDNLIERVGEVKVDGKETYDKVIEVEKSISSFKGAMTVLGGIFTLALVVIGALLTWLLNS